MMRRTSAARRGTHERDHRRTELPDTPSATLESMAKSKGPLRPAVGAQSNSPIAATVHTAQLPMLANVIGQRAAVERLKVAVAAAKADNRPLDHFLLTGPAGVGKTTLVQIAAAEMGVGFRES